MFFTKKKGVRLDHGASQVALVVKNPTVNARDARDKGSITGSERSPWSREWQPTPVFLPGELYAERNRRVTVYGAANSQT